MTTTYTTHQRGLLGDAYHIADGLVDLLDVEQYRTDAYQVNQLRRFIDILRHLQDQIMMVIIDILDEHMLAASRAADNAATPHEVQSRAPNGGPDAV